MKPANFPGRKNARRLAAGARWLHSKNAELTEDIVILQRRLTPAETARAIRTKKDRSHTRGIGR